jgi:hypothetical protein
MKESRGDDRPVPQSGYDVDPKISKSRKRLDKALTAEFFGRPPLETYARILLGQARELIKEDHFSLSVIACHIAGELVTEQVLSAAFDKKGILSLKDPVTAFLNGYNLATRRIRQLYTALTGDEIQNQMFWQKFKESAERRNGIVHRGQIAQRVEAEDSLDGATALIAHLEEVQERLRTP